VGHARKRRLTVERTAGRTRNSSSTLFHSQCVRPLLFMGDRLATCVTDSGGLPSYGCGGYMIRGKRVQVRTYYIM
jgi:hypothetical protein